MESNREPAAPKAAVLPSAPLPDGLFPRIAAVRPAWLVIAPQRVPVACLHSERRSAPRAQVGWEVLEPSSAAFQAAATPSQLPARQPVEIAPQNAAASEDLSRAQQKTRRLATPGYRGESPCEFGVTSVAAARASDSPSRAIATVWQIRPCPVVEIGSDSSSESSFRS